MQKEQQADQGVSECSSCRGKKGCCETVEEIEISDEELTNITIWVNEGRNNEH